MDGPSDGLDRLRTTRDALAARLAAADHATVKLVVAISVVALLLRLVVLGARPAHFDEGRVAYWAWHFGDTGSFAYRRIIHGPFIQHVGRWVFALFGPSDFTMRVPVAVVGSLLPLTVLLFREHLRRLEMVIMALLLAVNPVLLYYSRFMRSDVLVAAFMFAAFGLLVRFVDTRKARYLYAGAFFIALGFSAKENAIVYVLTWLGALGLLLAKVLVLPNGYVDAISFVGDAPDGGAIKRRVVGRVLGDVDVVVSRVKAFWGRHESPGAILGVYAGHVGLAVALFIYVSLFFYAPRGAGVEGIQHPPVAPSEGSVGFWQAVADPALFPDMVQATMDRVVSEYSEWFEPASGKETSDYQRHLSTSLKALGYASAPLLTFSVFGFVLDRLGYVEPRHLVPFVAYGGFVSIFGYPLGSDIGAPWLVVHTVVPLSLPAAVGLAAVVEWGQEALSADDAVGLAITGLVLVLVSALVLNVAVTSVYTNTTEDGNPLVQFAQPDESTRESLETIERVAAANSGGPDVVVYFGDTGDNYDENEAFVKEDQSEWDDAYWNIRPTCLQWHNTLPMPWYFAAHNVSVSCANSPSGLSARLLQEQPPVVITQQFDGTVPSERLQENGYTGRTHNLRTSGYRNVFTVWVHESYRDS